MKKIPLLGLFMLIFSCTLFAKIQVAVSIPPQETFVKAIAGDKVDIVLMVKAGSSPHNYEPKPSQMTAIANADMYLSIGVEFEDIWLPKFQSLNTKMQTLSLLKGIEKYAISKKHQCKGNHADHSDNRERLDPHIWTSPSNVKIIAKNIYEALVSIDVNHTAYYKKNLEVFLASVEETDKAIKSLFARLEFNSAFMVFHPSWGYFAREYHLRQLSVEVEGKSPKPKALVKLIQQAKKEKIKAIFTQIEFSSASADIIAKALGIPVIKVSALSVDWSGNLLNIASAISGHK
jgi:zinc transport system substrate-binding protein